MGASGQSGIQIKIGGEIRERLDREHKIFSGGQPGPGGASLPIAAVNGIEQRQDAACGTSRLIPYSAGRIPRFLVIPCA
jgi:hypothetical protein